MHYVSVFSIKFPELLLRHHWIPVGMLIFTLAKHAYAWRSAAWDFLDGEATRNYFERLTGEKELPQDFKIRPMGLNSHDFSEFNKLLPYGKFGTEADADKFLEDKAPLLGSKDCSYHLAELQVS